MTNCPCNSFTETVSGGARLGGSADVSDTSITITGGTLVGGSALVDVAADPWDGMAAVWHLIELGNGTADEYIDSTRNALHGTGGDGIAELAPEQDSGVFCLPSQRFEGRQFITLPADHIGLQPFAVSLWCRIDSFYKPRTFFSRGFDTAEGDQSVFRLGHTFANQITAVIQADVDGEIVEYEATGTEMLIEGRWYHFAASFDGSTLTVFVNGIEAGTVEVEGILVPLTNGSYLGRWNDASFPIGNIQEVRLHPEARDADWFLAEYQNFCGSLYSLGAVEEPTLS